MLYSSDPDEKEVTGWLKPRVLKPELIELGLLSNPPTHTHTHSLSPSGKCGPHSGSIGGKVLTGPSVVSSPRFLSLNTELLATATRPRGGGRREEGGERVEDKERGAAGQQLAGGGGE